MPWFAKINNVETGPLTANELKALASTGKINSESLIHNGDNNWVAASRLKRLFSVTDGKKEPQTPQSLQKTVELASKKTTDGAFIPNKQSPPSMSSIGNHWLAIAVSSALFGVGVGSVLTALLSASKPAPTTAITIQNGEQSVASSNNGATSKEVIAEQATSQGESASSPESSERLILFCDLLQKKREFPSDFGLNEYQHNSFYPAITEEFR